MRNIKRTTFQFRDSEREDVIVEEQMEKTVNTRRRKKKQQIFVSFRLTCCISKTQNETEPYDSYFEQRFRIELKVRKKNDQFVSRAVSHSAYIDACTKYTCSVYMKPIHVCNQHIDRLSCWLFLFVFLLKSVLISSMLFLLFFFCWFSFLYIFCSVPLPSGTYTNGRIHTGEFSFLN